MRRPSPRALALAALSALGAMGPAPLSAQGYTALPGGMREIAAYQTLARRVFDGVEAWNLVAFMDDFVRLPGNTGFDASIGKVVEVLEDAGYVEEGRGDGSLTYRVERRPLERLAWEPVSASLEIVGEGAPLLRLETNRNVVALNSWSTPPGGVEAEVVDGGRGRPEDLEAVDVRGKIVFAETSVGRLFTEAVVKRGALGVVAYSIPAVNRPEEHRNVIAYASIPQDTAAKSWGMQLTTDARDHLRAALGAGPVRMRVNVTTRLFPSEELTLVAEVRGRTEPDRRFVLSAHVQEAGANDNATGVAAQSQIARIFAEGVRTGALVPARTVTMIWGDEIRSTARYIEEDSARAAGILWGMSLDMVGEDTDKTGGTFLIEKMPDPSAVWTRGEDRHTEWGGRPLTVDQLTPHYFNDVVLNRCRDQGADDGWVLRTNPYEGGSDHVPFLRAGIPGLLLWHFTDVFYHTDGDRVENVSPRTLTHVGVCAAVTAMTLASANGDVARHLVLEVEDAAVARLAAEEQLALSIVAEGGDAAEQVRILEAWASWYDGALARMTDIEVGGPSQGTTMRIDGSRATVARVAERAIRNVEGR